MRVLKATVIFVLALIAFARLAPQDPFNPQHWTRVGLALSLTQGKLDIDPYAPYTVDKSFVAGHYYADKQPGISFMAVPVVVATRMVLEATGAPSDPSGLDRFSVYVRAVAIATVSIPAALSVMLLYLLALRLGASHVAATFASCALALGTPFFGWSTTVFAHSLSGAILLGALALMVFARRAAWLAPAAGLLLGYLLVIDITAAPAAAVLGVFLLLRSDRLARDIVGLAVGGVIGLLPLLVYNQLTFGSPFRLGYSQVQGFEGMQQGFFGITFPQPVVLGELLFGGYRGLLPLAPVLLMVPLGWLAMLRQAPTRGIAIAIAAVALCFILINASYFYWDGGASTGPRHLVAALPLACLALAFAWPPGRPAKLVAMLLLLVSLFISMIVASIDPMSPPWFGNPFFGYLLPGFFRGPWVTASFATAMIWLGFALVALWPERSGAERHQLAA